MLEHSQEDHWFYSVQDPDFRSFRHKFRHGISGSYRNSLFTFYRVTTVLLSITLSIHSPPMDRFASEMLNGLWASLHRPSLLLLRCHSTHTLSCPRYPLARQCGTALPLGLCSNAISLAMPSLGSGSLLCISECKAHTPSEPFCCSPDQQCVPVTLSSPQHRAMHSPLEWVHGRPLWYTASFC